MPIVELIMPKMGESITEATILKWLKNVGDNVDADEPVVEIATDKVDSEVPSTSAGIVAKILYKEGDVVEVGKPIMVLETAAGAAAAPVVEAPVRQPQYESVPVVAATAPAPTATRTVHEMEQEETVPTNGESRFYSPLVLNIAKQEGISISELSKLRGTGKNSRVTKNDVLSYLENRGAQPVIKSIPQRETVTRKVESPAYESAPAPQTISAQGNVEIIEMDRMRRLIADHMVMSKKTSPHVTSFVEADVTNMVLWREKVKDKFLKREGEKMTFTPLFIEVIIKALKDFPQVNASVNGHQIMVKKDLNIGMATALPSGNLIVPVLKNADQFNLMGLTKQVNRLANNARNNKLTPADIDGGTFTLSNVGTFGNLMGTPIINQPQLAILATGAIKKKPVVIETPTGDTIGIRHMMFLSLSYDHRVIDGFMGGSFLRRLADYMESFDGSRDI